MKIKIMRGKLRTRKMNRRAFLACQGRMSRAEKKRRAAQMSAAYGDWRTPERPS